jgi:hypothetical protein
MLDSAANLGNLVIFSLLLISQRTVFVCPMYGINLDIRVFFLEFRG